MAHSKETPPVKVFVVSGTFDIIVQFLFLLRVRDSASAPLRHSAFPKIAEVKYLRLLTPTENKRLNELIGFLCVTVAVLAALALISYSPRDAAWNVSANGPDSVSTNNWIGPAGAYGADLLFQVFGFAAFLLPMALAVLGWRWLKNRAHQFANCHAGGLRTFVAGAAIAAYVMAFPGCSRHSTAWRNAGYIGFRRFAYRL